MTKPFTHTLTALIAAACLSGCSITPRSFVTITNTLSDGRQDEMVEIPLEELHKLHPADGESYLVSEGTGEPIPSQVIYDGKLIFPASVDGKSSKVYIIRTGIADSVPATSVGRKYPERLDDLAWENDKAGYRAYGPALQARGEKAFGYDIFTKSVATPVLEQRYALETDQAAWDEVHALDKAGQKAKADRLRDSISYHVDHGNGMDCYGVGATLGGGTAALLTDSGIVYPSCYKECEVLDNGPLRFTARLVFHPLTVNTDGNVVETRLISLDAGSYLNRTEVTYENLSADTPVAAGIVLHAENPEGYSADAEQGYIAYADFTDNAAGDNGILFIGAVTPQPMNDADVRLFNADERQEHSGALGHVLGISTYHPGTPYLYYWGSGWSKADMPDMPTWEAYLKSFAQRLRSPLIVKVN